MQITISRVSKSYGKGPAKVAALREVSLQVETGEFLCLRGPSGSGKSTCLNLLGLLDLPDEGTCLFGDQDVSKLSQKDQAGFRNRHIGFVFQSFNLVPVLSSLENVMFPLQVRGANEAKAKKLAGACLERVGLAEQAHRRPDQLSGGQRQRVAIARALVGEPSIVLADEPTANLDSETSSQILDLMSGLNRESATTFVLATHDREVSQYATRHVYLRDGQITSRGGPSHSQAVAALEASA